jgi:hypothetical protein
LEQKMQRMMVPSILLPLAGVDKSGRRSVSIDHGGVGLHKAGLKRILSRGTDFWNGHALGRCPKIAVMVRMDRAIRCPKCGSPMSPALAPGDKGRRSLRCEQCERPDPLTAGDVAGWLKGELRPPT